MVTRPQPPLPPGRQGHSVDAHALYLQYSDVVFHTCLRRLGDREEAADVVQETFLNAWLALRRGVRPETPSAWLLTIARNLCASRYRAKEARVKTSPLYEAEDSSARERPAEVVVELTSELRRLPKRQRSAFLLYEIQGLSHRETAAELGISYTAAVALVFRARRALAERLVDPDTLGEKLAKAPARGSVMGLLRPILETAGTVKIAAAVGLAPLAVVPFSNSFVPGSATSRPSTFSGTSAVTSPHRIEPPTVKALALSKAARGASVRKAHAGAHAQRARVASAQALNAASTAPGSARPSPPVVVAPEQNPPPGSPPEAGSTSGEQGAATGIENRVPADSGPPADRNHHTVHLLASDRESARHNQRTRGTRVEDLFEGSAGLCGGNVDAG